MASWLPALWLMLNPTGACAADADEYWLPRLPVTVQLRPDVAGGACDSAVLVDALRRRTFLWMIAPNEPGPGWQPDFELKCAETEEGKLSIRLDRTRDGGEIYKMIVTKVPPEKEEWLTAKLIAQTLAEKRRVIEPALAEYLRGNQYALAEKGAEALQDEKWNEAIQFLNLALESGLPSGSLHYGLALAHAKLHAREQALWHYLAYLQVEGKSIESASKAPLDELTGQAGQNAADPTAAERRLRAAQELAGRNHWNDAILALKDLVRDAPWALDAYELLADAYDTVDWDELAKIWKSRGKLAKRVAKNKRNHDAVLTLLEGH